jgi:hypothetical protein
LEKEKETKNGAVLPGCVAVHPLSPGMASSWQSMNSVRYEDNVPTYVIYRVTTTSTFVQ